MISQLLPSTVRIKRRKTDNPADALYPRNSSQFKYLPHKGDALEGPGAENGLSSSAATQPSIHPPTLRATRPGEEDELYREERACEHKRPIAPMRKPSPSSLRSRVSTSIPKLPDQSVQSTPRYFVFSKLASSGQTSTPPSTGKKRKHDRGDVATFIEKKRRVDNFVKTNAAEKPSTGEHPEQDVEMSDLQETKLKRSLFVPTQQERAQRAKQAPDENRPGKTSQQPDQIPDLAAWLQFADEVVQEEVTQKTQLLSVPDTRLHAPLKYKPKAPARRFKDRHAQPSSGMCSSQGVAKTPDGQHCHDGDMDSDEGEWVYDTYIRVPINPTMDEPKPENHGIMVIEQEDDRTFWELYGEDEDDSDQFDDDEDSNAEDYYGADYPEEEVSSDDEFDRDPYQYAGHGFEEDAEDDFDSDNEYGRNPYLVDQDPWSYRRGNGNGDDEALFG